MTIQRIKEAIRRKLRQNPIFYPKKKDSALRWGVMGLGNMAEVYASALDDDKDSKIVAVASRSKSKAENFAKRHGQAQAYGSYEEMLNDSTLNLDVVYIATPAKYHAKHIRQCLGANRNVLCEKPITTNREDFVELIRLSEEKELFLMEGMWTKCLPTFQQAKKWIQQGVIGDLQLIKVDFYKREQINPELAIFNAKEGGGVLHDYGIYAISFVTSFLGGKPSVLRKEMRKSVFNIDADWQIYAEREGVKAFVSISSNFKGVSKAALVGNKGVIEFDSQFNRTNRIIRYDEFGRKQEVFTVDYKSGGLEYEINAVRESILSKQIQSSIVPLNETLETLEVMDELTK